MNNYEPSDFATTKLLLSRTLVLSVISPARVLLRRKLQLE